VCARAGLFGLLTLILGCDYRPLHSRPDDGGAPHPDQPIWLRQFPCDANLCAFQLAGWSDGTTTLVGGQLLGSVVFDDATLSSLDEESGFFAHISATGNVKWARLDEMPAGGRWQGWALAEAPDGSLYEAGAIVPQPYQGVLGPSVIRKLDVGGDVRWTRSFDLPTGSFVSCLAVAADDTLYASGELAGSFDFGGGPLTSGTAAPDLFALRLDTQGQFVSAGRFASPSTTGGYAAVSATGLIATMFSIRGGDGWLANLFDSTGQLLWSHTLHALSDGDGDPVFAFVDDDLVVVVGDGDDLGSAATPAGIVYQAAVARFDRTGRLLWKRTFTSDYHVVLSGLAVDASRDVALCGSVAHLQDQTFTFGSLTVPWAASDVAMTFVGKLDENGDARWVQKIAAADPSALGSPQCAVDAAGAVRIADTNYRDRVIYVAEIAP